MRGISSGHINPPSMATVTAVTFIVAFAHVLCGHAQTKTNPVTGDCSGDKTGTQEVKVNTANTTLTLLCKDGDTKKVTPAFGDAQNFKICTQESCADQQLLSKYIDGATGEKVSEVKATVQIKNLPSAEKTFYVRCGDAGMNACYIKVTVAQAPSGSVVDGTGRPGVSGGVTGSPGGVTTKDPLSCSTPGGAITIKIPEKGSTAQFTCKDLTLYPAATDRVFAEDCKKEESLKDIVRSVEGGVYTLTADKKPPKKKWCYLCAKSSVSSKEPGKPSDYCVVHVESSTRTQSNSAVALAAMLPCILAVLRIT